MKKKTKRTYFGTAVVLHKYGEPFLMSNQQSFASTITVYTEQPILSTLKLAANVEKLKERTKHKFSCLSLGAKQASHAKTKPT